MSAWIEPGAGGTYRIRHRVRGGKPDLIKDIPTLEEAERLLAAWRSEVELGSVADPSKLTLRAWGAEWLDRREISGRVRGIRQERGMWRHVERAHFIDWELATIRTPDVNDWIEELGRTKAEDAILGEVRTTDRELSPQTIRHAVRLLKQCLGEAVARDLVEANVAKKARLPKMKPTEFTFLSVAEIRALLTSGLSDRDQALFTLAIYSGMRRGELFALRWDDVDLERGMLSVRRGASGPTKSGKVRHCPLLPPARSALRSWAKKGQTGLVFPAPSGGEYSASYDAGWADRRWRRKTKKRGVELETTPGLKTAAGITRPVRFHDLRHTCASHLVMGTWGEAWSLEAVCAFMGHGSITMTQRYAHLAPGHLAEKAARTVGHLPQDAPDPPKPRRRKPLKSLGAPGRIRTSDLQLRKPLLYPAELREREQIHSTSVSSGETGARWRARGDCVPEGIPRPHDRGPTTAGGPPRPNSASPVVVRTNRLHRLSRS